MYRRLFLLLVSVCFLVGCSKKYTNEEIGKMLGTNELEYSYNFAEYIFDVNDLNKITTYVDYVFVGKVTGYVKTEYDEHDIYTYYEVEVLDNLKGELKQDEKIILVKDGGITKDHKMISLVEGDIMPQLDSTYVFCAYVMEDINELFCFGPNTVCEIENIEDLKEDDVYIKYFEALKNEADDMPIEVEHVLSKYDVNYSE